MLENWGCIGKCLKTVSVPSKTRRLGINAKNSLAGLWHGEHAINAAAHTYLLSLHHLLLLVIGSLLLLLLQELLLQEKLLLMLRGGLRLSRGDLGLRLRGLRRSCRLLGLWLRWTLLRRRFLLGDAGRLSAAQGRRPGNWEEETTLIPKCVSSGCTAALRRTGPDERARHREYGFTLRLNGCWSRGSLARRQRWLDG